MHSEDSPMGYATAAIVTLPQWPVRGQGGKMGWYQWLDDKINKLPIWYGMALVGSIIAILLLLFEVFHVDECSTSSAGTVVESSEPV